MYPDLLFILPIIFLATLVRSTFGFGESLVAVPLLLFFLPLEVAVPLSVLVSISIAAVVLVQDYRQVHFRSAQWLIFSAVPGIPIGLFLLLEGNESLVKIILGLLLILYSLYSLFGRRELRLASVHRGWLFFCGFLSGIFGGAYGLNGPPLVIYGNMRRWEAGYFRATLQAYFLPASILGMAGYWLKGLWTPEVTHYFLASLPVVLPAIFLGRYLNQSLNTASFFAYIYIALLGIGMSLLFVG